MYILCLAMDLVVCRTNMLLSSSERLFVWADDLTAKIRALLRAIPILLLLQEMEPLTNLKVNMGKTVFILAITVSEEERAAWGEAAKVHEWECIAIVAHAPQLGVPVGNYLTENGIWQPVAGKVYRELGGWGDVLGYAPPEGEMTVINVFIVSKFQHLQQFYRMPAWLIGRLRVQFVCFVCGLNLCRAMLLSRLKDLGGRREPRDLREVGEGSLLRVHVTGNVRDELKDALKENCDRLTRADRVGPISVVWKQARRRFERISRPLGTRPATP